MNDAMNRLGIKPMSETMWCDVVDTTEDMVDGLPLEPFKFICHKAKLKSGLPIRGGLARLVAFGWMCKS